MEPVQACISGHMQLNYMKTQQAYPPGGEASPAAFVGSDYYCESALNGPPWACCSLL